ncbi:hypothetical protein A2J04_12280 [Rhodococcus sp. EPR-279]|nr:hypothetical protein A2J04_12280 [Rhodococcus sp. EPR-279]
MASTICNVGTPSMSTTWAVDAPDGEVTGADRTAGEGGVVVVGGGTVVVVVVGGTVVVVAGTSTGGGAGDSSVSDGSVVVGAGASVDSGTIDVTVGAGSVVSGSTAKGALRAEMPAATAEPHRTLGRRFNVDVVDAMSNVKPALGADSLVPDTVCTVKSHVPVLVPNKSPLEMSTEVPDTFSVRSACPFCVTLVIVHLYVKPVPADAHDMVT